MPQNVRRRDADSQDIRNIPGAEVFALNQGLGKVEFVMNPGIGRSNIREKWHTRGYARFCPSLAGTIALVDAVAQSGKVDM